MKRDGRLEWLRLTKTTRSVAVALCAAGPVAACSLGLRASELAARAVALAREAWQRRLDGAEAAVPSALIGSAVVSVLRGEGLPEAASAFGEVARRRQVRARLLAGDDPVEASASAAAPAPVFPIPSAPLRRQPAPSFPFPERN